MDGQLLNVGEAASRLGLKPPTLYDWLGRSDYGLLEIRGQVVHIDYLQGGPKGQGHIRIPAAEVERIKDLMRVRPKHMPKRRPALPSRTFPGITVALGRPSS